MKTQPVYQLLLLVGLIAFEAKSQTELTLYERALLQWGKMQSATMSHYPVPKKVTAKNGVAGVIWAPIGPSPLQQGARQVNGMTTTIAIHPTKAGVMYQGTAGGGVWVTTDGGNTWSPLFNKQLSLSIGGPSAIAFDPNNPDVTYVATSPALFGPNDNGILRSTDGGSSWILLGSGFPAGNIGNARTRFRGQGISTIVVDASDSNILYISAYNGLFRSTDGGLNWTVGRCTSSDCGSGQSNSLVEDSTSPAAARILYAAQYGKGIVKSTDGGQNWTPILTKDTPAVAALLPPTGNVGAGVIALAPATSPANANGVQILYAAVETGGGPNRLEIFESTDQGTTWVKKASSGFSDRDDQGGVNFTLLVDPSSPGDGVHDIVYWGGVKYYKSSDSGDNFSNTQHGIHDDAHCWAGMVTSPGNSTIFTGNDGGIWKSTDKGNSWSSLNGGGLQTTLFYELDLKQDAKATTTLGALQDNGIALQTAGSLQWVNTAPVGDGFSVAFDRLTPNTAYCIGNVSGSSQGVFSSGDGGSTWTDISSGIPGSELGIFRGQQVNVDPKNTGGVYVSGGAGGLFQSSNGGSSFRNINSFAAAVGPVNIAPANAGNTVVVAVGSDVFLSTDALSSTPSFTTITRDLPGRMISQVAFDPNDSAVIYATLVGFDGDTARSGHVFRTRTDGSTWQDISPPVDAPANALAVDGTSIPSTVYVGIDLGVVRSVDGGTSWTALDGIHLPNVPVTDLKINETAGVIRAATYGRGVFELQSPSGPAIAVTPQATIDFGTVCPATASTLNLRIANVGSANLTIHSIGRLVGSSDFTVLPTPATPAVINPLGTLDFTIQFAPTAPLGTPEQAVIRITSNDPNAPFVDATVMGTGNDTQPPSITCPPDMVLTTDPGKCSAANVNFTVAVSDNCPGVQLNCNPPPGSTFAKGVTIVGCRATDVAGNSANCSFRVTVLDKEPPVISGASVSSTELWPPNHKMVNVTVNYTATDNCGVVSNKLLVTSNEPANGSGDGNSASDWDVVDAHHVRLRAERSGRGNGRVYTIKILSTDSSGNLSSTALNVTVPKNQKK